MSRIFIGLMALLLPLSAAADDTYTEDELLQVVLDHNPAHHEGLLDLRERHPELYQKKLDAIAEKLQRRDELKAKVGGELAVLKEQLNALKARYHEVSERQKDEIQSKMELVASEIFDLQLALKRQRLATARAELEQLEADLLEHELRREQVIQDGIEDMLAEEP